MKIHILTILFPAALCLLGTFAVPRLQAQKVIGGTTPDPSALLDVQSAAGGILPPRMSTAEREAIIQPATGLLLYNTTKNCMEMNVGMPERPAWGCLRFKMTASAASASPSLCVNTTLTPITHITSGATGIGSATGLPPGVSPVWASNTITISGTPTAAGTYNYSIPVTGGCGSATGTITVPSALTGCQVCGEGRILTFSCYNLGAVATTDPYTPRWELNGAYYQWGRATVAAAGPTGPSSEESNDGAISGWNTTAAINGAWADDMKTANDPCPAGFRVPTKAQWDAVINTGLNPIRSYPGTWTGGSTNYSSGLRVGSGNTGLFLSVGGFRDVVNGVLFNQGWYGNYWSSTGEGSNSWNLIFTNGSAYMSANAPTQGLSIRCIAE